MSDSPDEAPARLKSTETISKLTEDNALGRSVAKSYYNKTAAKLGRAPKYPNLSMFLDSRTGQWIRSYLKYALQPRWPFPTYANHHHNGIYQIKPAQNNAIHFAIAGDWGSGTREAWRVANQMRRTHPDFTLHLGDIYYVGDKNEIEENCFGKKSIDFEGVVWPKGTQGSFALNGNHEMYANGRAYFETFLSHLGLKAEKGGQQASYFCLETEFWRIIGLDTGYNSVGWPLLSSIPLINEIPAIGGDCHLEASTIDWLKNVVGVHTRKKPTVLLTHHNYFSAFPEKVTTKPARQLAELFAGQELIWLWGHEHRLGIYDRVKTPEGLLVHGRCIGHGGMPVTVSDLKSSPAMPLFFDPRSRTLADGTKVGRNGYAMLSLEAEKLSLRYYDIRGYVVFTEHFTPDAAGNFRRDIDEHEGVLKRAE